MGDHSWKNIILDASTVSICDLDSITDLYQPLIGNLRTKYASSLEHLRDVAPSKKSDLECCAKMTYFILTGKEYPIVKLSRFGSDEQSNEAKSHSQKVFDDVTRNIPAQLLNLFARAIRYPRDPTLTIDDFAKELESYFTVDFPRLQSQPVLRDLVKATDGSKINPTPN